MTAEERAWEVTKGWYCDRQKPNSNAGACLRVRIAQALQAAVAEEARKWGSGSCSAHQVPAAHCQVCNYTVDVIAKAVAEERERIETISEEHDCKTRLCNCSYEITLAIRRGVKP